MAAISLKTAISISGLSRRTIWRRIEDGCLTKICAPKKGGMTRLNFEEVLSLSCLPLKQEDHAVIFAADQGDAVAQCDLALLFLTAHRARDAAFWFDQSAQQSYPDAMCFLGRFCLMGKVIPRNVDLGISWLNHAAAKKHLVAQSLIGFLQTARGRQLLDGQDLAKLEKALDDTERYVLLSALAGTVDTS